MQIVRGLHRDTVNKQQMVGVLQRLIVLPAQADVEHILFLHYRGLAVLGIEVQAQYVTPVPRTHQRGTHDCKWVLDQGIDIAVLTL